MAEAPSASERALDDGDERPQALLERRVGAVAGSHAACVDAHERDERGAQQASHLARENAESRSSFVCEDALSLPTPLGHGARDGVVETRVERLELLGFDVLALVYGKARDDLAEIAVVVDDLRDRQALPKEVVAVSRRASFDLDVIFELARCRLAKRLAKLIEEDREAVHELHVRGRRGVPLDDAQARSSEDLFAIRVEEIAQQHAWLLGVSQAGHNPLTRVSIDATFKSVDTRRGASRASR